MVHDLAAEFDYVPHSKVVNIQCLTFIRIAESGYGLGC